VLFVAITKFQTNPRWSSRVTARAPNRWEVYTGPCIPVKRYYCRYRIQDTYSQYNHISTVHET